MPNIHERIKGASQVDPETGWHSRGYLPHLDGDHLTQFITFRLADSLPRTFLRTLKFRLDSRQITDIEYHREIEKFLDLGHGPTYLQESRIASIVIENLLRFHGEKYELLHWTLMPNHVHLLLRALYGNSLSSIMHSMKSFTASRANKALGRSGAFWSIEYYDRYIRDASHFSNVVSYIHMNPVKADLCDQPEQWPYGCAGRHE